MKTLFISRRWTQKERLLVLERLGCVLKLHSRRVPFMNDTAVWNIGWRIDSIACHDAGKINGNAKKLLEGLDVQFKEAKRGRSSTTA